MADGLGRLTDLASNKGLVEGFTIGRDDVHVSHLQSVDGTLFFALAQEGFEGVGEFFGCSFVLCQDWRLIWGQVLCINVDESLVENLASSACYSVGS